MKYDKTALRPALRRAVLRVGLIFLLTAGYVVFLSPNSPLPDEWHPFRPLDVAAPVTPLTDWKLRAALGDDAQCLAVMGRAETAWRSLPDFEASEVCHIRPRVALSGVGAARLSEVETRCQTALRMAMWERHGLQVAARRHLGAEVARIRHYSSYNCRKIRTGSGNDTRMSTHATANSIDISGFDLSDGRRVDLKRDWPGDDAEALFLRDAFQSACLWFPVALGPGYNALHADHFHLQTTGWGLCR